MLFAVSCYTGF